MSRHRPGEPQSGADGASGAGAARAVGNSVDTAGTAAAAHTAAASSLPASAGDSPTSAAASPASPASAGAIGAIAATLASRPGLLLIVADFDGTLAEASRDPGAARVLPLSQRALRRIAGVAARHPDRVAAAVLTGRTVADVSSRVGVGGIRYLGDHGLQVGTFPRGSHPGSIMTTFREGHEASHEPAEHLAERVPALLGHPAWLFVERKGPSVAFHVRQADDPASARAAVQAAIVEAERDLPPHDLAHYRGRLVVDLRPRDAGGKREAMGALLAELRPATVIALGDDSSDADGFAVLRAARAAGTCDALAIAVTGPRGVPDDVRAAADVVLATPRDAARFLSAVARAVAAAADPQPGTTEAAPSTDRWQPSSAAADPQPGTTEAALPQSGGSPARPPGTRSVAGE